MKNRAFGLRSLAVLAPCMLVAAAQAQPFVIDDIALGQPEVSYIDPEFLPEFHRACWQDELGRLWIGQLNPVTGVFVSPAGRDVQVDSDLPSIAASLNGPEWGRDVSGVSLFYARPDGAGVNQVWRAELLSGTPTVSQLTVSSFDLLGSLVSFDRLSPDVRYFTGNITGTGERQAYWGEDSAPGVIQPLPSYGGIGGGRWIPGTQRFVYVADLDGPTGPEPLELAIFDSTTGQSRFVTEDGGNKVGPWPFFAPEFGGELLLMVNISNQGVALYRDNHRADGIWDRFATLRIPAGTGFTQYFSAEPVQGLTGVRGRSYFSVGVSRLGAGGETIDASMWLLGLAGSSTEPFARRVDIGAATGEPARRLEPETHLGKDEVFLYYSISAPGNLSGLQRARTGLFVCRADVDGDGIVAFADVTNVLANFGRAYPTGHGPGDANGTGFVTFADITQVLAEYGTACPTGPAARR